MRTLCAPELHHPDSSLALGNGGVLTVTTQPAKRCLCVALSLIPRWHLLSLTCLLVNGMGPHVVQGFRPSSGLRTVRPVSLVTQRSTQGACAQSIISFLHCTQKSWLPEWVMFL